MHLQLILVAGFVAGAVCYLARQTWRTWSGRPGGCSGCGSKTNPRQEPAPASWIPSEELTLRSSR